MTQQETTNPIKLYERAVQSMRLVIAGVKPEQLNDSTPCREWNVQELLNHNINVARMLESALTGSELANPDPMDVSKPLPQEGAAAAFEASTTAALNAAKAPGMVEKVLDTPLGPMSAGNMLIGAFGDVFIHQWDLAQATKQDFPMDNDLAAICHQVMGGYMEQGRGAGFIGPAIAVSDDSSAADKLLGFSGRQP